MIFGIDLNIYAIVGILLLIGIVKKNAIMMIDFALEAQRNEAKAPARSDLPGRCSSLPSHHDDHARRHVRHPANCSWIGSGS